MDSRKTRHIGIDVESKTRQKTNLIQKWMKKKRLLQEPLFTYSYPRRLPGKTQKTEEPLPDQSIEVPDKIRPVFNNLYLDIGFSFHRAANLISNLKIIISRLLRKPRKFIIPIKPVGRDDGTAPDLGQKGVGQDETKKKDQGGNN